jgi:AbrB family looped-hinge helix DNA binding protein
MALAHSRLTAQGQISVPVEIRKKLGVGPGGVLEWDEENGQVVVRRAGRYTSEDIHHALFAKPVSPRTLEDMKTGIASYIKGRHARR